MEGEASTIGTAPFGDRPRPGKRSSGAHEPEDMLTAVEQAVHRCLVDVTVHDRAWRPSVGQLRESLQALRRS
jgi:hypothetical protein